VRDEPDPPPKKYGFKARSFEAVNPPIGTAPKADKIDVQDLFNAATAPHTRGASSSVPPPPKPPIPSANDIHALLRDNLAHEVPKDLPPPVRLTRRRNDYILCLLGGNATIAAIAFITGLNPATVLFGSAGALMFSIVLTWVMWFVMDDY